MKPLESLYPDLTSWRGQLDQAMSTGDLTDDVARAILDDMRHIREQLDTYIAHNPQNYSETRIFRGFGYRDPGDEAFLEAWNQEG
jgi:hypothetical protein